MIVVDANVVAYFLIEGAKTVPARKLRATDPQWRVPPLWRAEFLNVLAMQVQHGGFELAVAEQVWQRALGLFSPGETEINPIAALRLAAKHRITAYDAQYAALAEQLGVQCVSEDRELVRKLPKVFVTMAAALASA